MRLNNDGTIRVENPIEFRTFFMGGMKPQDKKVKKALKNAKKKAIKAWNDLIK